MKTSVERSWLIVPMVALALGAGAVREACAEALPTDPATITSLTPEQAATLAATYKGKELRLGGLESLSPDVARALCGQEGGILHLDGVTDLSTDTAEALGEFKGGILSLGALTALDVDTAAALATLRCPMLRLGGLKTISDESAKALAEFRGQLLWLHSLAELSPEAARAFAAFKGQTLMLPSLAKVGAEGAEALAEFKGKLIAPQLLFGIGREPPLTPGSARIVHAYCANATGGPVVLPNITTIDTPEAIEAVEVLATAKGQIELPRLKTISAKCLPILATKEDLRIPPSEQLEIIPDGDGGDDIVVP